ncbi:MAG: carbonate dehydratase [Gammaproteobacteria bacterium]|nr:carbonate dehydratase [Gammaproteobacteria bacterium]
MAHHDMTSFHHSLHWSYTGIGAPQYWGDLKEDYALCKDGTKQSPVDISAATITSLDDIKTDYKATPLDIVNNGHAIQVNYAPGSSMTVDGKTYQLLQFHFHSPSEHTIGGKSHALEAHLVHKADDGQLAVIGVMIDAGGPDNPFIAKLWSAFPAASGDHNTPEGVEVNVADLLPPDLNHFNYTGSLTTPPCSENVNWLVLSAPIQISDAQLEQFRASIVHDNRPVQPLNGRVVRLGN